VKYQGLETYSNASTVTTFTSAAVRRRGEVEKWTASLAKP
jgi:hypothetical protein